MSYDPRLQRLSTKRGKTLAEDGKCVKDIFQAAIDGDVECLACNIEDLGIDINSCGKPAKPVGTIFSKSAEYYATPLHYACSYGRYEAVKYLVSKHANKDLESQSGLTPKDYARIRGYDDIQSMVE